MSRARKLGLYLEIFSTMMRNMRVGLKRSLRRRASLSSRRLSEAIDITGLYPQALTPGDTVRGENWLAGDYTLPGALVKVANTSPFDVPVANSQWLASLHGFDWLRHICALSAQRGPTAVSYTHLTLPTILLV